VPENTPYWTAVTDAESIRHFNEDEPGSLDGSQLISIESDANTQEQDIFVYVHENFPAFLQLIKSIRIRDSEMLRIYYVLRKTQSQLGPIFGLSQTIASFNLRMAVKVIACLIMFGGAPTQEQTRPIFEAAGLEEQKLKGNEGDNISVSLSQLLDEYEKKRSFQYVAQLHGLHRPEVRRTFKRVSNILLNSKVPEEHALGAWVFSLIDKANPHGTGQTERYKAKSGNIIRYDPPELGQFRVKIGKNSDELLDQLFAPMGIQ
jgi:hypothetical protein